MKVEWKPQPYAKKVNESASSEKIKEALCLLFMFGVFTFILLFFSSGVMMNKSKRSKLKGHPTKKMVTLEMMIARSTYNKRVAKSRANRKKKSGIS